MTNIFSNSEFRYERLTINEINDELQRLSQLETAEENNEFKFSDTLKERLLIIERHYAIANNFLKKKEYGKAINEYNLTQSLVDNLFIKDDKTSEAANPYLYLKNTYPNSLKSFSANTAYIKRFDKLIELSVKAIGMLHTDLNFEPAENETIKKPIRSVTDLQKLSKTDTPPRNAKEALLLKQSEIIKKMPHIFEKETTQETTDIIKDLTKETIQRELSFNLDNNRITFKFYDTSFQDNVKVLRDAYSRRNKGDINYAFEDVNTFILQLAHISSFVIPLSLADCYYNLYDFHNAEIHFKGCLNYPYINEGYEAKTLWLKTARLYYTMGNNKFLNSDPQKALDYYSIVIPIDANINSYLFNDPNLRGVGNEVKKVLSQHEDINFAQVIDHEIAALALATKIQIKKIENNLDIWGNGHHDLAALSFQYLKPLAIYFTQQCQYAQKQYVVFQESAATELPNFSHLNQIVSLSQEVLQLTIRQKEVFKEEAAIFESNHRFALDNINDYKNLLSQYRNHLLNRDGKDISSTKISSLYSQVKKRNQTGRENSAANINTPESITGDFEITSLANQIEELSLSAETAYRQLNNTNIKLSLLDQYINIAKIKLSALKDAANSFNTNFFDFTTQEELDIIYQNIIERLFNMAYTLALHMQKTYNCEFNTNLNYIKDNYPPIFSDKLTSSDLLLNDINQFAIPGANLSNKRISGIQQTISLASNYPFLFEENLQKNGTMRFQTRMEDFDLHYSGTYMRKIQHIDVRVEGLAPGQELKGYLTNNGLNWYRTERYNDINLQFRAKETHIFQESNQTNKYPTYSFNTNTPSSFAGAGVCSYWELELPRLANNLSFSNITDIKLTFYFECNYSEELATRVKNGLINKRTLNSKQRFLPLKNLFPENYYSFLKSGNFKFNIINDMFPENLEDFKIDNIGLIAKGTGNKPVYNNGKKEMVADLDTRIISLKTPNLKDGLTRKISLNTTNIAQKNNPWGNLIGGDALGEYEIKVNASDRTRFENIDDFVLILEYSYKIKQ